MFTKDQIAGLFDLIATLKDSASVEGVENGLAVVDADALQSVFHEASRLKSLEQRLVAGFHEHGSCDILYYFLVPKAIKFGKSEFKTIVGDDFTPEKGDYLEVKVVDDLEVITEVVPLIAINPKFEVLEELGYDVQSEPGNAGRWVWFAPSDATSEPFDTRDEAIDAAWEDAVEKTLGISEMTAEAWEAIPFEQQVELISRSLGSL